MYLDEIMRDITKYRISVYQAIRCSMMLLRNHVPTNPAFARLPTSRRFTQTHQYRWLHFFYATNLKDGEGDRLPIAAWIANLLDSIWPYCQLVVAAAKELDSEFLSPELSAQATPGTELELQIRDQGKIYVISYCQGWWCTEGAMEFLRPAQDVVSDGILTIPVRGDIAAIPGDAAMWQFLRSCLSTCLAEHPGCAQEQNGGWFPERVVTIERRLEGDPLLRLVEIRQQLTPSAYIALSHCWGSESFLRTTTSNLR
jgi:hypothetical protein